jgi:hypothetical protein
MPVELAMALLAPHPVLQSLLETPPPADVACSVTLRTTTRADGEESTRVFLYDRETDELSLGLVDGVPPTAEEVAGFEERNADSEPPTTSYAGAVGLTRGLMPVHVSSDGARHLYRQEDLGEGKMQVQGRDISKHLHFEVEIEEDAMGSYVRQWRFYAPKPFRMALVAKVDAFEFRHEFERLPDGRPAMTLSHLRGEYRAMGKADLAETIREHEYRDCPAS